MAAYPERKLKGGLQVIAQPTDTFVQAPQAQKSRLWDIAGALGDFEQSLGQMTAKNDAQAKADAEIQAQADFLAGRPKAGPAEKHGLLGGLLNPSLSKAYNDGYSYMEGDAAGADFQAQLDAAWAVSPLKESDDPDAYHQFSQGFMKDYLSKRQNDPAYLKGIVPHVHRATAAGMQAWSQERANRAYERASTAGAAAVSGVIDGELRKGKETGTTDYDAMWAGMMERRTAAEDFGMKPTEFDKQLFKTIAAKAVETGDEGLLTLFDKEVPGQPGVKFSDTPDGLELKSQTEAKMASVGASKAAARRQAEKDADEKSYSDTASVVFRKVEQEPNYYPSDEEFAAMERKDPDIRTKYNAMRENITKSKGQVEDPRQIQWLEDKIVLGGEGEKAVWDAAQGGMPMSPGTRLRLLKLAEDRNTHGAVFDRMMQSDYVKQSMSRIGAALKPISGGGLGGLIPVEGVADAAAAAQHDYTMIMADWLFKNPTATSFDILQQSNIVEAEITKGITAGKGLLNKPPEYNRPAEVSSTLGQTDTGRFANPHIQGQGVNDQGQPIAPSGPIDKGLGTQNVPKPEAAAVAPVSPLDAGAANVRAGIKDWSPAWDNTAGPPKFDDLPDGERTQIDHLARTQEKTRERVIEDAWTAIQRARQQQDGVGQGLGGGGQGSDSLGGGAQGDSLITGSVSPAVPGEASARGVAPGQAQGPGPADANAGARSGGPQPGQRAESGQAGGVEVRTPFGNATITGGMNDQVQNAGLGQGQESGAPEDNLDLAPSQDQAAGQAGGVAGGELGTQAGGAASPQTQAGQSSQTRGEIGVSATPGPVGHLLDFVASKEAPNGYEETYGNTERALGGRRITDMTLAEVRKFQQDVVTKGGSKSSAVGRYQFIRKTFDRVVQEMGLDPNTTKFTPEVQDAMAIHLLKGRGLDRYLAGDISREQFAHNLAKEWASLPAQFSKAGVGGYRRGSSVYAGLAGNKSFRTPEEVLAAVDAIRGHGGTGSLIGSAGTQPTDVLKPGGNIYANIPQAEQQQFREWNPDPVGMEQQKLKEVKPELGTLYNAVKKRHPHLKFVLASGLRDNATQQKALDWGWSKKKDSNHLHGEAIDVWPLDENGAIVFDRKKQAEIAEAFRETARASGINIKLGIDWKTPDRPHIELAKK